MTIYESIVRPVLFCLPAETAHRAGTLAMRAGLGTNATRSVARRTWGFDDSLQVKRFGLDFPNPLGVAAGFDKNGVLARQLAALGFGFVEAGTVTFRPQKGNRKPRLFRLPLDLALINRLGFNNDGAERVAGRLLRHAADCVIGVNIGRNKEVANDRAVENYLKSFDLVYAAADYVAVNVSSPNTPGLRALQSIGPLETLLGELQKRNTALADCGPEGPGSRRKPLLVKIAPDLSEAGIEAVADLALRLGLSGIIAVNTTVERDRLRTPKRRIEKIGKGGLSGKPIREMSNRAIEAIYRTSKGKLPVIGVGGVFSAEDAFEKIASGASLVQSYTGFVYHGPRFAFDINSGLARILGERGFSTLDDAVGSGVRL